NYDMDKGLSSAPPTLIGEGERVQTDWLYAFLRDPQRIRRMTEFVYQKDKDGKEDIVVLRMPKFNMSEDEARVLTSYFAAVSRLTNPGIGLPYPYEQVQPGEGFKAPYFLKRNAEYIKKLKDTPGKDGQSPYVEHRDELRPLWKTIAEDHRTKLKEMEGRLSKAEKELEAVSQKEKEGPAKDAADRLKLSIEAQYLHLKKQTPPLTPEAQENAWNEREAYVIDGFRILVSTKGANCLQCHTVGNFVTTNPLIQGPPLAVANPLPGGPGAAQRLRPDWTERWLANPQRLIPYTVMTPPFQRHPDEKTKMYPHFAGGNREQLTAVRDILMMYPEAAALPVNRYWVLPPPEGKEK